MAAGVRKFQFSLSSLLAIFTLAAVLGGVGARWGLSLSLYSVCVTVTVLAMLTRDRAINLGAAVIVSCSFVIFIATLRMRDGRPSSRSLCVSHNRQVAIALLAFSDTNGHFPPAFTIDDRGTPLHSWRTLILPYLDRHDVYKRVDWRRHWDSASNQFLGNVRRLPFVCNIDPVVRRAMERDDENAKALRCTNVLAITGPGFAFQGANPVNRRSVKDPYDRTILYVDLPNTGIPWPEPRDMNWEEVEKNAAIQGGLHFLRGPRNCIAVMCLDGIQRHLPNNVTTAELRAVLTIAGGETVDPFVP